METDKDPTPATSEQAPGERGDSDAQDAGSGTNGQQQGQSPKPLVLKRRGAKKGNRNSFKHGGRALQVARQRHLPIDHRTRAGIIEMRVYADLLVAWGKVTEQTADKLVLDIDDIDPITLLRLQMVSSGVARWYQHRQSRAAAIRQAKEAMKKKGQKVYRDPPAKLLQRLDSYELPALSALRADMAALGLPPSKEPMNLNDILAKIAGVEEPKNGNDDAPGGAGANRDSGHSTEVDS
jgi:hypothetical protein